MINAFEKDQYVAFKNIISVMAGKIDRIKPVGKTFKYYIKAIDAEGMVSTYEVLEKDVSCLPSF